MNNQRLVFGQVTASEGQLTVAEAEGILRAAVGLRTLVANTPLDKIYAILSRLSDKWADPAYSHRVAASRFLPGLTGFAPEMIELGLDELSAMLKPDTLDKKLRTELGSIPRAPAVRFEHATQRSLSWHPLGIVFHVLSGNVFLVGPGSLIEGLLTGNISLLKMSSQETEFMPLFMKSVIETEVEMNLGPLISQSVALLNISSSQNDVLAVFKNGSDALVVWGGEEAVRAYREGLPARTRLVVFGPKLSMALVTEGGFAALGVDAIAARLADELAIWDQNACTAPQVCFVEGEERARALVAAMPAAMRHVAEKYPAGRVEPDQAAEIRKLRTVYEIAAARGKADLRESSSGLEWTILYDDDADNIETSPLHRTIRIVSVQSADDVLERIDILRAYVQTVGIIAPAGEALEWSQRLGERGVLRILELGQMSGGGIDDPHDGAYDLPQLMNCVVTHLPLPAGERPFVCLPQSAQRQAIDALIRTVVARARELPAQASPYGDRLAGIVVGGIDDLPRLPVMERGDMDRFLFSAAFNGGNVTRSGGSTGTPMFSYFDGDDWRAMAENAAEIFRACGLRPEDRVANCMFAGDLYGSFVSFNDVMTRLGTTNFNLCSAANPEILIVLRERFGVNVVLGMPSTVMPLLRAARKLDQNFAVEKVVYAGMPMSRVDKSWLRDVMGVKTVASIIGTTEVCQLAYQDATCDGNWHVLADEYNYVEVLGKDDQPLPEGEVGRLVVTSLRKLSMPILRYAIGDSGAIVSETRHGVRVRKLQYLGRADDIMCIGCMNVRYGDLLSAVQSVGVTQMQLIGRFDARGGDVMVVRVEGPDFAPECSDGLRSSIYREIAEIEHYVREGKLAIEIEVLAVGAMERNPRTGKIKAMIDERFVAPEKGTM